MDEKNPTAPGAALSFNAKLILGIVAGVFLWMIFGPNSKPPKTEQKPSAEVASKPIEEPPARTGRYVMNGTRVRIVETVPACASLDNLAKFRQLATEGDRQAVMAMIDRRDCRLLDEGAVVTVQAASVWRSAECVRVPGEIDCLWTLTKSTEAPAGG